MQSRDLALGSSKWSFQSKITRAFWCTASIDSPLFDTSGYIHNHYIIGRKLMNKIFVVAIHTNLYTNITKCYSYGPILATLNSICMTLLNLITSP